MKNFKNVLFKHLNWLILPLILISPDVWGAAVNSEAPANGQSFIIALYYNGNYYALPQFTTAGTPAGKQCTLDENGKVTAITSSTIEGCLWTLKSSSTNWKITYTSGNTTYYLWKTGTTGNNYNIAAKTTDSDDIWSFTSGTANSKTAYSVKTTKSSATKHTVLKAKNNTSFQVNGTDAAYAITLLKPAPTITCATTSLSGFTYQECAGPSTAQSFSVSGSYLTANITVTAPSNYEVSKSSGSGYASSVTLTQSSGSVSATTVYIRLKSGKTTGTYNGTSVTIASTGATSKTISLSGTVTAAPTTSLSANPNSITFDDNTVDVGTDDETTTVTLSNGYKSDGYYLYGWFDDLSDADHCTFYVNDDYTYTYTTGTGAQNLSPQLTISYLADATGTYTGKFYLQGHNACYEAVNCTIPLSVTITSACDYKVTLTKSAATNGTFTLHSGSASGTEIASGGEVDNCESDAIVYVVPSPSTGYQTGTVSATNKKTLDTDGDNTVLTYAKGSNIASTVSVTFEAKTYTINFNQTTSVAEPASGGESSVTATYADDCPTIASLPTKEHYNFAGYWTEAGGTGTQVVNADGTWISTVSGYTKNGKWDRDGGVTLHAKWTAKSYTITWQTRGDSWAGKGGSTTANYGAAWSTLTLPTDPDPTDDDEGCGDKFVGWIVGTIDGELDKDDDAAAISALVILNSDTKSGLTGQTISGATTFNAVFADYDE